jgi:hypothetical protein
MTLTLAALQPLAWWQERMIAAGDALLAPLVTRLLVERFARRDATTTELASAITAPSSRLAQAAWMPGRTLITLVAAGAAIAGLIQGQACTDRFVATGSDSVVVPGVAQLVDLVSYRGDAIWTGYPMIAGRWYSAPGEAVAPTALLQAAGAHVGDSLVMPSAAGPCGSASWA